MKNDIQSVNNKFSPIILEIRPKGITLQKFEAIHNKDYSVVKTFKVAEFRRLFCFHQNRKDWRQTSPCELMQNAEFYIILGVLKAGLIKSVFPHSKQLFNRKLWRN